MEAEHLDTQHTARKSLGTPVVGEPQFRYTELENIDTPVELTGFKPLDLPSALEFMCVCVRAHVHTHICTHVQVC